jgi:hypothetical protein
VPVVTDATLVTGIDPALNLTTDTFDVSMVSNLTVPGGTFASILVIYASVEFIYDQRSDGRTQVSAIDVLVGQSGAGGLDKQLSPVPNLHNPGNSPSFAAFNVGGLADLGAPPLYVEGFDMEGIGYYSTTLSTIGVWTSAGAASTFANMGEGDWDPTKDTVLNFGDLYMMKEGGTFDNRIGRRQIIALGY